MFEPVHDNDMTVNCSCLLLTRVFDYTFTHMLFQSKHFFKKCCVGCGSNRLPPRKSLPQLNRAFPSRRPRWILAKTHASPASKKVVRQVGNAGKFGDHLVLYKQIYKQLASVTGVN
jgi:hypothetical protein